MSDEQTKFDYDPAYDESLETLEAWFLADLEQYVPVSKAISQYAVLVQGICWAYENGTIPNADARQKIREASQKLDAKFDQAILRLPR